MPEVQTKRGDPALFLVNGTEYMCQASQPYSPLQKLETPSTPESDKQQRTTNVAFGLLRGEVFQCDSASCSESLWTFFGD